MPLHTPQPAVATTLPPGVIAETLPRSGNFTTTFALGASSLRMTAIAIPAGKTITSVTFLAASTVPSALTSLWAALYDVNLNLLAQSPNDAAPTWTESTFKTFTLTAPVTTTYTGQYYVGVCEAGTTRNGLACIPVPATGAAFIPPYLTGSSTSGSLTTTAPNPAGALGTTTSMAYAYVSGS